MSDKRKTERIKKALKSEVHSDEQMTFSSTVDLSSDGIFISTPEPLKDGTEVKLSIQVPGEESLEINGVVRWTRPDESENSKAGMGIEFIQMDSSNSEKIQKILK